MKFLIYISIFLGLTNIVLSQSVVKNKKLPRVFIGQPKENILYIDNFNIIIITTSPKLDDSLIVEASQGEIFNNSIFGKDSYSIRIDSLGKILIKVYVLQNKEKIFLGQRNFKVELSEEQKTLNSLKTKPNISLGKYERGKIPIDSIKKINCLTINNRYKLLNSSIYFSGTGGTNCTSSYNLKSTCFDSYFAEIWKRITRGTNIAFDRVEIMDLQTKKKYIIPNIFFIVVEN